MNKMRITINGLILALVLLNSNKSFAQLIHELDNIPFGNCLSKLDSNDLIKQLRREFDSTVSCFNGKQEKKPHDFKDKWKLVYYIHTGYEEVGGKSNRRDINNLYQNSKQEKWLTIAEIFTEFHISDTIPKKNSSAESYLENTFQINIWTFLTNIEEYGHQLFHVIII